MPDDAQASLGHLVWALSRPPIGAVLPLAESGPPTGLDDDALVARVAVAYRRAVADHVGSESFWTEWSSGLKRDIHEALMDPDPAGAAAVLRHPAGNTHFWGFDAVAKAPPGQVEPHELVLQRLSGGAEWSLSYARWLHDALISLAEAVGALRLHYPETEPGLHYTLFGEPADADAVLDQVEAAIGAPITFPNPYPGELGLLTRRGIAGFRSLQAVYQAWRVAQIVGSRPGARVLEIGAGLGRTAYHAARLGLTDYTIIDIPLTNAAQGYFLGRTLGADRVALFGEPHDSDRVKVLPPEALPHLEGRFDLVVNVDSFTELDPVITRAYWDFARQRAGALLSINHELNAHPVRELYQGRPGLRCTRHPYWMRRGYVEELITWA